ncbi:GGDEF domain-containing protein [Aestuariibacter sp. A3R04]|uniref:GGDEF domain-containing protein n=1 Tax=Aestuariibacter sp. A3R04 TaxID=2841571 RepID=UPI001C089891|nr:GGDEF domain-containing protein [Aestuariibacter sp. A3R04]MBU3022105.1 GGDEF domain-containing protein [Aestuariibacter sp. A3R04]
MDAKQIAAISGFNALLSSFIIRLSSFYEGLSADTDNELKNLRNHLSGKPDFTLATVSINKIQGLIQHADISIKQHSQLSIKAIEKTVKQYQQAFASDSVIQKQSAQLLMAAQQPVSNLFELQSLCIKAITLFGSVTPQQVGTQNSAGELASTDNDALHAKLFREIQSELSQLIDSYDGKQQAEARLTDLKSKLVTPLSEEELLKTCIVIIRMVVSDAMQEASLSGKMIHRIHRALGGFSKDISNSIASSQSAFEARKKRDDEFEDHLLDMEGALRQSDSLEKLKTDAQANIAALSTAIKNKKAEDNEDQQALMTLLNGMQQQMSALQKQTLLYRRKLAEQTTFSHTDPLTRLPNRLAYNERFDKTFSASQENGKNLALAVVDIDYFKSINDRFGHQAGDKTLQAVGQHLKKQLIEDEFIARWGGEEFVIIFPQANADKLAERLEAMRDSLARLPFKFKQEKVTITASFGGTWMREDDEQHTVFERADQLLYKAKENGRNRVEVN